MNDDAILVDLEIESFEQRGVKHVLHHVRVIPSAPASWIPRDVLESVGIKPTNRLQFQQSDGTVFERWTGGAILGVEGRQTADAVVFAEPGDPVMLGSRTLSGLNLRIDVDAKRLVDRGPIPAAAAA